MGLLIKVPQRKLECVNLKKKTQKPELTSGIRILIEQNAMLKAAGCRKANWFKLLFT